LVTQKSAGLQAAKAKEVLHVFLDSLYPESGARIDPNASGRSRERLLFMLREGSSELSQAIRECMRISAARAATDWIFGEKGETENAGDYFWDVGRKGTWLEKEVAREVVTEFVDSESSKPAREMDWLPLAKAAELLVILKDTDSIQVLERAMRRIGARKELWALSETLDFFCEKLRSERRASFGRHAD
jgi:hypothetical protein